MICWANHSIIPAKAGISINQAQLVRPEVPAFAGTHN